MRSFDPRNGFRRSNCNDLPAFVARLRPQVDHPVGTFDHFEIVLDHDQRIPALHQSLKQPHQDGDIVEMQSSRRLVENEKTSGRSIRVRRFVRQMPDQLQPLRFAAGQGVERLPEPQITEAHFIEHIEFVAEFLGFANLREKLDCFTYRHLEDAVDRFSVELDAQDVRLKTAAFALGAPHVEIAQELHLDLFEAGAATALATAAAGVEGERARRQPLRHRFREPGEKLTHPIVKSEVKNRGRAWRARELCLIDHDHLTDAVRARDRFARAGRLLILLAFRLEQVPIKDVVNQRGLSRAGHARDAIKNAERNFHVHVLEIVLARTGDADGSLRFAARLWNRNRFASAEIIARQRLGSARDSRAGNGALAIANFVCGRMFRRGAETGTRGACAPQHFFQFTTENQFAAVLAATGPDIDDVIGRADDRLLVFHHEQRVPLVAQIVHHAHEPADIARMQADAWFVHDEKRVHERRAEAGGEIHPLHFAAAERARGAVEREITEADFAKVPEPRDDFVAQHFRCGVVRRQHQLREKSARVDDGKQRHFRQRSRGFPRADTRRRDDPVIQRLGLEAPAAAIGARGIGAIAAEQNAHMHFVGLAFEPFEKSAHAVPAIVLGQFLHVGVFVARFAVDYEILVGLWQIFEGRADIDLFPRAGANEVALRFAHLFAAKNADGALRDRERPVRDRLVQINRDRSPETAALRTGAERIVETEKSRRGRPDIEIAVGAMPAGGERRFLLRLEVDEIDPVFAEAQRDLDRFDQARARLFRNRQAILNDLHARAKAPDLLVGIGPDDVAIQPDAQVALLLEELKKLARIGLRWDPDPKGEQDRLARELTQHVIGDGTRGLRSDLAAATRAKRARDPRHEEFQVIVDLRHRADGGARTFHRVRLLDRNGRRDAADFVHARFVHAIQKLPHVRTEGFDVAALAFCVDRVEGEARFAAATRPCDHGQFPEREIEVDPFEVVLARPANLHATPIRRRSQTWFFGGR